ncbi:MAG: adenylate kinase [Acidimicrobiia bacterium]
MTGVRLVMLGRQGAGKGTQCVRLAAHYGIPHISTGDMLRAAVREGTEFGRRAKDIMDRGELVSDEVMGGVVDERLAEGDTRQHGYILDGFPRTVPQAELLEKITAEHPLTVVVDLVVPTDVVLERLASRRVCSRCGTNYSLDAPPKLDWTCDKCGGEVIQRADDTPEAIQKRLDLYERETAPLIDWYASRDLLVEVDGLGSAEAVTERLIATVDARR